MIMTIMTVYRVVVICTQLKVDYYYWIRKINLELINDKILLISNYVFGIIILGAMSTCLPLIPQL